MAKPKKQTDQAEELATVLGLSCKEITARGETVRVEEFEIEQLPQLLTLIRDLTSQVSGGTITEGLLAQSGEIGIKLAMLATGKDRDWFRKLPLGDGLALYAAIIEVNQSFFGQIEQFTSLIGMLGGLMGAQNGRGSSVSLPAADTLPPPSEE